MNQLREQIKKECKIWKENQLKIGFTSGSFDLLHAGHIQYLKEAKKQCDKLIIGVNTDFSVKNYKDPNRPIIEEEQRLEIILSLSFVDRAFLFNETNNQKNIVSIQPDFYFKGQDYNKKKLTSAHYLEKWGGKVVLLPLFKNLSTTNIIKKIIKNYQGNKEGEINKEFKKKKNFFLKNSLEEIKHVHEKIESPNKLIPKKVIFLDRDGVINEEIEYLHRPEQFKLLPNVISGLQKMKENGYFFVIVTTQAGIGLGYFTKEDFFKVNKKILSIFAQNNINISKIYYCSCSKAEECDCRKPKNGLIMRAKKDMNIIMEDSFFIGDKTSDILAGEKSGLKTILVKTGHGGKDKEYQVTPDYCVKDLVEAAQKILKK